MVNHHWASNRCLGAQASITAETSSLLHYFFLVFSRAPTISWHFGSYVYPPKVRWMMIFQGPMAPRDWPDGHGLCSQKPLLLWLFLVSIVSDIASAIAVLMGLLLLVIIIINHPSTTPLCRNAGEWCLMMIHRSIRVNEWYICHRNAWEYPMLVPMSPLGVLCLPRSLTQEEHSNAAQPEVSCNDGGRKRPLRRCVVVGDVQKCWTFQGKYWNMISREGVIHRWYIISKQFEFRHQNIYLEVAMGHHLCKPYTKFVDIAWWIGLIDFVDLCWYHPTIG